MFRKRRWLIIGGLILAQVGVIACYQGFLHGSSQAAAVGCCANEQPQAAPTPASSPTAARSAPVNQVLKTTDNPPTLTPEMPLQVVEPQPPLAVAGPAPVVTPTELPSMPEAPSEDSTPVPVSSSLPLPPPLAVEPPLPPSIPAAEPPMPEPLAPAPAEVPVPPAPPAPISPPPLPEPQMTAPNPPPDVVVHPVVPAPQPQMPTPLPPVAPSYTPLPPVEPVMEPQGVVPASNTTPAAAPAEKPLPAGPCPWTLKMTVVDGLTVMEARIDKEIQFRIVCEKLDLASPRGSINAQGDVKISGSGLDGHCQKLLINWHDDHILVEGDAYLKCLREGHDVELNADRLSLRLSQSSTIKGLGKAKATPVEEVSEPQESRAEPVKAPAKPPTPIRAE